jgi:hypothetical protein
MIKNVKKFLRDYGMQHKIFLRNISSKKNIRILESMLSSNIFLELQFKNDDNPIALYKLAEKQNGKKHN